MIIEDSEFNKRIRKERERLGLSQSEMALALGVSLSTQGAYEGGTRVPDLTYLARLSKMEGMDTLYVLVGSTGDQTVSTTIDWELHDRIFEVIEKWERGHGVIIPPRKKMDALRFLYTQFRATGRFDEQASNTLINMVA